MLQFTAFIAEYNTCTAEKYAETETEKTAAVTHVSDTLQHA